jgi:hypothetical protein
MTADLRTFLENFRRDGHTTYVAIRPDGSTTAATFNGHDPDPATDWLSRQNSAGRNIYFTVNPTAAGLRKKPVKADITAIGAL